MSDNQPQSLTASGEPSFGPTATQRTETERAEAWAYYINGGGGEIAYFDGHKWHEMVCRRLADDEERSRENSH